MKWWPKEPERGDMIRVPVGSVYHYGIYCGEDTIVQFGPPPGTAAYGNGSGLEVCTATADEFSLGKIVETAVLDKKEQKKRIPPEQTVKTALSRVGEGGYDLLHNNCEHFVFECVFGEKRSTQEEEARKRWYSRPVFDCFFALMPDTAPEPDIIPGERAVYVAGTADERLRRARAFTSELICAAASRSFGLRADELGLKMLGCGAWTSERIKLSAAHTGRAAAVVVSNAPAGIDAVDLEAFAALDAAVRDRLLTRKEKKLFADAEPEKLAELLARKESCFKSLQKSVFRPDRIEAKQKDTLCLRFGELPGHIFAVHGAQTGSLRCYLYDGGKMTAIKAAEMR